MSHLVFWNILLMCLAMAFAACRSPVNKEETQYGEFDAFVPDGGSQPEAECNTGNSTYSFNNDLSPYFGGDESIKVDVVDFSSFYCGHCADFAEDAHCRRRAREPCTHDLA